MSAAPFAIAIEGGPGACSSESVANAGLARVGEAARNIVDGPLSTGVRGMPTYPWLRRERGARRKEKLVVVSGWCGRREPRRSSHGRYRLSLRRARGSAPRPKLTLGSARRSLLKDGVALRRRSSGDRFARSPVIKR